MDKLDLKKQLGPLYKPRKGTIAEVVVPPLRCLMVDGQGDPNTTPAYAQAVEALFSVSYTAKFMVKKGTHGAGGVDYAVMPLEGLWWADDHAVFTANDRAKWQWTMLIVQPDVATDDTLAAAIDTVAKKKQLPALDKLRLETFDEGRCAQLLHVGPFTDEGPAIQRLHDHIEQRTALRGKHHEIYLSDIRRANPANWKTIIRQPMD